MGPRKDEGSYWGYEEQGNGQLDGIQGFRNIMGRYVKGRQRSSIEAIKKETWQEASSYLWSRKLSGWALSVDGKNVLWLDNGRRHASRLPTCSKKQNYTPILQEKWRKRLKNSLRRRQEISVRTPRVLSLASARGFTPESVAQFCEIYEPAMDTIQHNAARLHNSDETASDRRTPSVLMWKGIFLWALSRINTVLFSICTVCSCKFLYSVTILCFLCKLVTSPN
jgi:hypothetical protein